MKPEEKEDDFASFQADATSWWGQNIYPHHQWRSCCHETLAQKIGIAKQMTTVTHTFQQPVKEMSQLLGEHEYNNYTWYRHIATWEDYQQLIHKEFGKGKPRTDLN